MRSGESYLKAGGNTRPTLRSRGNCHLTWHFDAGVAAARSSCETKPDHWSSQQCLALELPELAGRRRMLLPKPGIHLAAITCFPAPS
jgi:hypothetical protein